MSESVWVTLASVLVPVVVSGITMLFGYLQLKYKASARNVERLEKDYGSLEARLGVIEAREEECQQRLLDLMGRYRALEIKLATQVDRNTAAIERMEQKQEKSP